MNNIKMMIIEFIEHDDEKKNVTFLSETYLSIKGVIVIEHWLCSYLLLVAGEVVTGHLAFKFYP